MINAVSRFYKKNPTEFWIIATILLISAALRFYKLDAYMSFLGDEGRDALMIKRILTEFDIPLIGPSTSIGNMYLGPLYYYMMTIPMTIFWLNPVAAAGMVAILGTATVGLIYYFGRVWFGVLPAILASLLFAVSPVTIIYSKSSWNPNPAPFFSLLCLLGLFKAHRSRNYRWLILTGVSTAFLIQMHYLALILLPVLFIFWLWEFLKVRKIKSLGFVKNSLISLILFLLLMSPLLVFDLKHDFMNYKAISLFFSDRQETVNLNYLNSIERTVPIYTEDLIGRYLAGRDQTASIILSVLILIPVLYTLFFILKKRSVNWGLIFLSTWLLIGILGLSLYKRAIFDHYLGFLAPAPYLLLGGLIYLLKGKFRVGAFLVLILSLGYLNLAISPLLASPNRQLQRTQAVAKFIIEQSQGKPYNFALISEHNYDPAYQFYLAIYNHPPILLLEGQSTDQLFVVCEDKICQPVGHPKYEIAAFGWTKIESEVDFAGVKVFKLIHNPDQERQR